MKEDEQNKKRGYVMDFNDEFDDEYNRIDEYGIYKLIKCYSYYYNSIYLKKVYKEDSSNSYWKDKSSTNYKNDDNNGGFYEDLDGVHDYWIFD